MLACLRQLFVIVDHVASPNESFCARLAPTANTRLHSLCSVQSQKRTKKHFSTNICSPFHDSTIITWATGSSAKRVLLTRAHSRESYKSSRETSIIESRGKLKKRMIVSGINVAVLLGVARPPT